MPLPFRRARVVGDNTAAVRYGAGTGRYRRSGLQAQLEEGLAPLAAEGWVLEFQAVRRRLNGGADALATEGVEWAAELRARGDLRVQSRTRWL
eukprot:2626016-Pyramimonas_sp.AAC.1